MSSTSCAAPTPRRSWNAGHDRLACFGSGAARKKEDWQSLIRQMVAADFLVGRTIMAGWRSPNGARPCAAATSLFHYRARRRAARARRAPRLWR